MPQNQAYHGRELGQNTTFILSTLPNAWSKYNFHSKHSQMLQLVRTLKFVTTASFVKFTPVCNWRGQGEVDVEWMMSLSVHDFMQECCRNASCGQGEVDVKWRWAWNGSHDHSSLHMAILRTAQTFSKFRPMQHLWTRTLIISTSRFNPTRSSESYTRPAYSTYEGRSPNLKCNNTY